VSRSPSSITQALLLVAALACFGGCSNAVQTPSERPPTCQIDVAPGEEGLRILFIGNSLTYWFDIPGLLASLFEISEIPFERIEMRAQPNYGLPDHWVSSITQQILEQGWDLVIMQQGPSATEGRPYLLEFAARFAAKIRALGGVPAMLMVWPAESRLFDFDGVSDSYATAAEQIDGYLFPAGEAWRSAWARERTLGLYDDDRFHPSALGSYLAAITIFEQLAGRPVPDPPANFCVLGFGRLTLSSALSSLLRDAATEANGAFARVPVPAPTE
jgi:hypothetical protein